MEERINLLSLDKKGLEEFVLELGMKKFNAKQIYEWLHQKNIRKIDDMTNISIKNRSLLHEKAFIPHFEILKRQVSEIDATEKYLFQLHDKKTIETVLLRHEKRNTLCVSTQVGCAVGCEFCATGIGGFSRDLEVYEIINQVYVVNSRLAKQGQNITNIVFMGMGEPLLNFDYLLESIDILSNELGLNISKRKITISTCGIVPKIDELMMKRIPVELAISLHAASNEKRDYLIPINKKYPLEDLLATLREYQNFTGRRITFEYIMLAEFNIFEEDAENLANLLKGIDHTVNLIPYNEVEEKEFKRPLQTKINNFFYSLKRKGINVTIRKEKGSDIDGACGQLREKSK